MTCQNCLILRAQVLSLRLSSFLQPIDNSKFHYGDKYVREY
jgi:hypothetical protein